ncbi:MAG: Slp family lipoprotein [Rhodanobacteraceae bacterium]
MRIRSPLRCIPVAALAIGVLLSGCVSTPVFTDVHTLSPTPAEVAVQPERYHDAEFVWGGKILDVRNLTDTSEVQVVAYPLDRAQRPNQSAQTEGRFIVELPGYVEALDYPPGRFLTLRARLKGTHVAPVDEQDYVFPLVAGATIHLWPVNFPYEQPRVQFGIGVGVGIH